MATWEQRRRGILRTALEMERDLYAAENRYIDELRTGMLDMQAEFQARLNRMNAQPRSDGNFDWDRHQTEALLADLDRQIATWQQRATSTVQAGTTAADEMGGRYPIDILRAGGSSIRVTPRLGGEALAMFHAYDAGLVKGVSDRTRADITGLVRRAALGGDSVFSLAQKIGDVAGKGAFATAFHRGEAIIRTEMGRSYSSADMATMWATAGDHPGLQKKWLSIIDGRTRPEHAAAHDQTRPLLIPFSVGGEKLMHPHDTNGSAWNTINCRCKAVPWDPAWEKLPAPGVKPELGPLVFDDRANFDSRVEALERMRVVPQERYGADSQLGGYSDRRVGVMALNDEMLNHRWPTPMNPAYWRTKPSFTLKELQRIGQHEASLAAFLRERYGIQLTYDPFDQGVDFTTSQGQKLLQALEAYRALDPAFVTENAHLRYIGTSRDLGHEVLGEASVFGDVRFNALALSSSTLRASQRGRDPRGMEVPRLSDDVVLESMLHEIGHAISYRAGVPFPFTYKAIAAIPESAWYEFQFLHNTSTSFSGTQIATRTVQFQREALEKTAQARREMGFKDTDKEQLRIFAEILRLQDLENELREAEGGRGAGGNYPTDYARTDYHEDFAETAALAILNPTELRTQFPQRYAWVQKYMPALIGGSGE